jgi:superfamily I DNA and/or RNA helicase
MNVGLTRAKRGLFLVGNMRTLRVGKVGWLGEEGVLRVDGAKGSIKGGDGKNSEREIDAKVWGRYIEYLQRKELVLQMSGTGLRVPVIGKKALAAAS